ncbi:hypothetical protein GC174_16365 [bacterium]|nr:hypothetical protein [bacterium]
MVDSYEHFSPAQSSGESQINAFQREYMVIATNPTEPSGPRGRGDSPSPPSLPPVSIDSDVNVRNNTHIRNDATGIGIGHGGDGGDARSSSSSRSEGGDARSNSSSRSEGGDARSNSSVGDVTSRSGDSSASIQDNDTYRDESVFIVNDPPDLPDLPGGTSGVSSRVHFEGMGSNAWDVYEAKEGDAMSIGISVGIPGAGGGGFGFGQSSTYTSEEGLQRLDNAERNLNATNSMFWGQVLSRDNDPTNDGISRYMTGQGAALMNEVVQDSRKKD